MSERHYSHPTQHGRDAVRAVARPDRRCALRDGLHGEYSRADLVRLILSTYAEMPGLSVYGHQAERLFGLRERTCLVVLTDLVREGRLRRSPDGQYYAGHLGGAS